MRNPILGGACVAVALAACSCGDTGEGNDVGGVVWEAREDDDPGVAGRLEFVGNLATFWSFDTVRDCYDGTLEASVEGNRLVFDGTVCPECPALVTFRRTGDQLVLTDEVEGDTVTYEMTTLDSSSFDACPFVPFEICDNGIDDDCNGDIDCADDACEVPIFESENCDNGVDDDDDGDIDCDDCHCREDPACSFETKCTDAIDNDNDGDIDCDDADCAGDRACNAVCT